MTPINVWQFVSEQPKTGHVWYGGETQEDPTADPTANSQAGQQAEPAIPEESMEVDPVMETKWTDALLKTTPNSGGDRAGQIEGMAKFRTMFLVNYRKLISENEGGSHKTPLKKTAAESTETPSPTRSSFSTTQAIRKLGASTPAKGKYKRGYTELDMIRNMLEGGGGVIGGSKGMSMESVLVLWHIYASDEDEGNQIHMYKTSNFEPLDDQQRRRYLYKVKTVQSESEKRRFMQVEFSNEDAELLDDASLQSEFPKDDLATAVMQLDNVSVASDELDHKALVVMLIILNAHWPGLSQEDKKVHLRLGGGFRLGMCGLQGMYDEAKGQSAIKIPEQSLVRMLPARSVNGGATESWRYARGEQEIVMRLYHSIAAAWSESTTQALSDALMPFQLHLAQAVNSIQSVVTHEPTGFYIQILNTTFNPKELVFRYESMYALFAMLFIRNSKNVLIQTSHAARASKLLANANILKVVGNATESASAGLQTDSPDFERSTKGKLSFNHLTQQMTASALDSDEDNYEESSVLAFNWMHKGLRGVDNTIAIHPEAVPHHVRA